MMIQYEVAAASDLFIKTISSMQIAVGVNVEEASKRLRNREFIEKWMEAWMTDTGNDIEVKTGVEVFIKGNVFNGHNSKIFQTLCPNEIDIRQV